MALAFVLVPIGAAVVYGETLGVRYLVGLMLVLFGIALISNDRLKACERDNPNAARP